MKIVAWFFSGLLLTPSVYADGAETYAEIVMGVAVVVGFFLLFAFFALGKYITKKLSNDSPLWLQNTVGIISVIVFFSIWGALAG